MSKIATVKRECDKTSELSETGKLSALKIDMNSLLECVQEKLQKELQKYSLEKKKI